VDKNLKDAMQGLRPGGTASAPLPRPPVFKLPDPVKPPLSPPPVKPPIKLPKKSGMNKSGIKEATIIPDLFIPEKPAKLDMKAPLDLNELKFIQLFVVSDFTIDKAMSDAGFGHLTKMGRYLHAKSIIVKYESQAETPAKILRDLGYGELRVSQLLIDSATNAKGEMVRFNARAHLSKVLGMVREQEAQPVGVQIIISRRGDSVECKPALVNVTPALPAALPVALEIKD